MVHTTVDYFGDTSFSGEAVYLTDMERCLPPEALSAVARKGYWRTLEYETESLAGTLIAAGPETAAPDVIYPSEASGWHAVSVGVLADRRSTVVGVEAWRTHREEGMDPFRVAKDYAHEMGLEVHASYRVGGFHFPPMHDHFNHGASFYKTHPELRGVDRSGNPTPRISYAYPEVREFVVSLLTEMAGFPIQGVCLLYNRRPPLVEYEPPVVQGFIDEYGDDPRRLDPMNRRWLAYRARVLTQFMREVRDAMDVAAAEQRRSSRIEVSAVVLGAGGANLANGMDLKAWVEAGIVDTLIPYSSGPTLSSAEKSWTNIRDIDYFVSLTDGTPCKLAPNILPRVQNPESFWETAARLYAADVEYLFFWDCDPRFRAQYGPHWNALRGLSHRDGIASWVRDGIPGLATHSKPLRKLGDWDLSYDTPG